jgi:3-keto-disaccharide hydrolase
MKTVVSTLALAITLAAVHSARAADQKVEKGYISLFNGKDLTGWKKSDEKTSKITVKDGKIVCQGSRSHLFTVKQFKNFHFKAEVMTTPGSNSGIYFHTHYQATGWPKYGYESQVNVSHTDPVKTGSIYNTKKLYTTPAKDNKWWTQEIIVKGKHVVVKIDGKQVIDYIEPPNKSGTVKLGKGSFALQAHDPKSVTYYRNIRVKPLPDDAK